MSEAPEKESKTEEATPQKLEKAKEKGDVPKTMDLAQSATLAAAAAVVLLAGGWLSRNLAVQLKPFVAAPETMTLEGGGSLDVMRYAIIAAAPILAAVLGACMVAGAAANIFQSGVRFVPDKVKPDFKKVSPRKGFERLFGPEGLMQFVKSLVKVVVIGLLVWWILKPFMPMFPTLSALDPAAILPFMLNVLKRLVFSVVALTLAVAGADYLWQRQRFFVRQRMTKEEVKQDYKNSEGDPHVRARQKQIRNERSRRRMMQSVPDATLVIMNPTHYAVALRYEQGQDAAPVCVAKGLDSLALKIRAVAEEAGVPVIEDPPLARALYAAVEIDEMIPTAHYEAVAKIIGFILNTAQKATRRRRPVPRPL